MKKTTYKQPTLKVVAFKSEQGFATSGLFSPRNTELEYQSLMGTDSDLELLLDDDTSYESFWASEGI